ncbi:glycoside hydrolase family 2 TIM barrel-domain containing protein [uncultured Microbacterium sp.]|uniref:glycoside hydrolase family 2 TIM barrel-domain containing protein n=1 Tax=uncultured Microbacterium sp. TaxID=191216 RepID=UPI0028D57501|nr:glycoside hydrolase family 2 TIM barrel-domain containing protein [uncultured Microbacterium sp.]
MFAGLGANGDAATAVHLPHDALRDATRRPDAPGKGAGAYYPNAAYSYVKSFHAPGTWEGRLVRLEIQGAYRRAQVFINDELAGIRADGYARFFVDLTPFLRFDATNTLRIEVRSGQDSRWYSGAGLHRPVLLHVSEPVHIEPDGVTVRIVRIEPDQAVVEIETAAANAGLVTRSVTVETTATSPDRSTAVSDASPLTLAPGESARVRQRLYIQQPQLWGPDNPALYTAHVRLTGHDDNETVTFGIREITVDPRKGLRINGQPVLLRGACIHSDNGPLGAAAIGRADERRVELLKAAGFNAIRAAHNPASPALLDACDRLGMLVMDEAFDVWTRFKTIDDYAFDFPQWWASDLESMVIKNRNHPSVIMHSIGNEIAEVGTPHGARWARRMAEHVRNLDPSRPVTNGVNPFLAVMDELPAILEAAGGLNEAMSAEGGFDFVGTGEAATRRTAESSAALDVLGLNYSEARYALDRDLFPNRVIVGSETFPGQIGKNWPLVQENPNVIGDFAWTGWDYLGEVGLGSITYEGDDSNGALEREYPFLTAWCGDIDITGWRRPLSYYREIVFGLRTEPYISVRRPERHGATVVSESKWAWSDSVASWTWPGHENHPVAVEVYADADEVILQLDGHDIARAPVGTDKPMLAVLETPYRPGQLVAIALRDGRESGRTSLTTAGSDTHVTATADQVQLTADDDSLAYIAIELRDESGVLVTADDREITVHVEGDAILAGICSANPKTTERFDSNTWKTFDGRALAVVRPTGVGTAVASVTSPGLHTVSIHFRVGAAG